MNKLRITDRIFGYAKLELTRERSAEILDLFVKSKVIFKTQGSNDGNITLIVPYRELSYIKKLLGDEFGELKAKCGGVIKLLHKYRYRPGILVGVVLALAITYFFSILVWNIEVEGNKSLSDEYVLSVLDEYGLRVGVPRASVDLDKLSQNIMISDGNIGWLSVNFRGTTAYVEVIEYAPPDTRSKGVGANNIVASRDGRIVSIDVYEGSGAVGAGDTVKAGDLLISGIVDSATSGYKLKSAEGSVVAEVLDTIEIEIPYNYTQKVSTGKSKSEKSLIFLGKRIKLSKNSGNVYDKCDIIEKVKRIEVFDVIKLPLEIAEITYNEYEDKSFTLTPEEARARAFDELEEKLALLAHDGDVTQKKITAYDTESSYKLTAVIYHTEEITKIKPISQSKNTE